jgi:hypothetical protein
VSSSQGGQGGFAGGQGFPQVSDSACALVTAAMTKKPDLVKKLDSLRARVQSGELDRTQMRDEAQKIYTAIGVDPRTAMACRFRAMGAPTGAGGPQLQVGTAETGTTGIRLRPGLVFIAKGQTFEPRVVMLGAGNFDYTEVVSGLQEGDQVALLSALSLEAQRQDLQNRIRQGMGGVPGMNQQQPAGGNRGGGSR